MMNHQYIFNFLLLLGACVALPTANTNATAAAAETKKLTPNQDSLQETHPHLSNSPESQENNETTHESVDKRHEGAAIKEGVWFVKEAPHQIVFTGEAFETRGGNETSTTESSAKIATTALNDTKVKEKPHENTEKLQNWEGHATLTTESSAEIVKTSQNDPKVKEAPHETTHIPNGETLENREGHATLTTESSAKIGTTPKNDLKVKEAPANLTAESSAEIATTPQNDPKVKEAPATLTAESSAEIAPPVPKDMVPSMLKMITAAAGETLGKQHVEDRLLAWRRANLMQHDPETQVSSEQHNPAQHISNPHVSFVPEQQEEEETPILRSIPINLISRVRNLVDGERIEHDLSIIDAVEEELIPKISKDVHQALENTYRQDEEFEDEEDEEGDDRISPPWPTLEGASIRSDEVLRFSLVKAADNRRFRPENNDRPSAPVADPYLLFLHNSLPIAICGILLFTIAIFGCQPQGFVCKKISFQQWNPLVQRV